jgi:hypothetical protein
MRVGVRTLQGRGSINVQAYVDVRKLAKVADWMVKERVWSGPMQYGKIMQYCLECVLGHIESLGGENREFDTIGEALEWLENMGFPMGQFEGYGKRNIVKALQEEAYKAEVGRGIPQAKTLAGRPGYAGQFSLERSPVLQVSQEQLERDVAKALKEYGEKTLREPETLEEAVERRAREDRERREQMAMASELLREPTYTPEQILENKKKGLATLLAKNFVGKQTGGQIFPVPKELEELCGDEEVLKMAEEMATRLLEERGKE